MVAFTFNTVHGPLQINEMNDELAACPGYAVLGQTLTSCIPAQGIRYRKWINGWMFHPDALTHHSPSDTWKVLKHSSKKKAS